MARRAAPGVQLSAGRLRVDAARAIAKLREYQLAHRPAWVLEAIRAAVASRATRISLTGDTNDLWLAWDCEPWPAADLPRLFDELVGPEASDARYAVRLLAAAVNSALGMDPVYVDVFAIAKTGEAVRARYTPDVLDEPESELAEAPLRRIALEPAAPPPGAGPGMALHLRRRFGFAVISHLVSELPEIELARAACADLPVPLLVRGAEHGRGATARDLVRIPLGDGLQGFLAIVDPDDARTRPVFEVAEQGVVLERSFVERWFPPGERPVPVRVFVDGPRMPTNASRSEVRSDVHPISTALRRARTLLATAIERLGAELAGAELAGGPRPERARAAALLLHAAADGDAERLGLEALRNLPLARNAVGEPRAPSAGWGGLVHTGRSPLPAELAPWLGDVLWIPPGDPSACLVDLERVDGQAMKRYVRWARREQRARRRFYGHAPRPPVAELREPARLRARLGARAAGSAVDPRVFEGLTGEVCILPRGAGGELVLLLDGRELERITYESPIPFAAVIDSPKLAPADRYRSAARDAELARCEVAMRTGVLCAVEAIAADAEADGFVHGERDPELDRRRAIDGLTLARDLSRTSGGAVRVAGPLLEARLWRSSGADDLASVAELRRQAVVGVTAPGARLRALPRRSIVEVEERDQPLLAALLAGTARIVPYDGELVDPDPVYSIDLAQELLEEGGLALALRGEGCAAAIAPSAVARVVISHMGRRVQEREHKPALVSCTIYADSDDVVPDGGWYHALDDGGIGRQLEGFELELVRAAGAALAGARPPDLLGLAPVDPGGALARALWLAIGARGPDELLGEELAERLRDRPLARLLGERELVSPRDLAWRFAFEIPYLDVPSEPIAGFTPLVADSTFAHALGRLAGRAVTHAGPELERRRRTSERDAKLARLHAQPALPLELPGGGATVKRAASGVRAVVGVGRGAAMELEVRVEGRPLLTITRPGEPPIAGIADILPDRLDEQLGLPPAFETTILRAVRGAIPELLAEIARAQPAAIADLGPTRTLLAKALAALYFESKAREALTTVEAFPTIQGPRTSIEQAARDAIVSTASWTGEWIPADAGEEPSPLDGPVLFLPTDAGELLDVVARLHRRAVVDLTEAVAKLQAQRRIARGLLPPPTVPGVAPELKRRLADLGPEVAALGPGEIGLVDEAHASALIHVHGELRQRLALDVLLPVHLAVEAPELAGGGDTFALRKPAREAARLLLRAVIAQVPVLPVWLRHRLRRALLAGELLAELEGVPLFETAAGAWVDRAAIARQVELLGDVWCIPWPVEDPRPLDERRLVVLLGFDEQSLARGSRLPYVDATRELALDAKTRANLARPRPASLGIDAEIATLAVVGLGGDGSAGPRGAIAVLAPHAALHRGIYAHRELYPFDACLDECAWPTRAVVDDPSLAPDRTWARPVSDAAWDALVAAIRNASERVLRDLVRPPQRALASEVVDPALLAELPALHGDPTTQLRGALWIEGAPGAPGRIELVHAHGTEAYAALGEVALRGTLHVYGSLEDPRIRAAVGELCEAAYARMLRRLAARPSPSDLAVAHIAHGLALDRIAPDDAVGVGLGCFRPRPITAHEWQTLSRSSQRLPLIPPGASADELSVTDDGTATARVVLDRLGARAYPDRPVPLPGIPPERAAPPLRVETRARPAHALDPLVAGAGTRLRQLGLAPPRLAILEDAATPIVHYLDGTLGFAGRSPRLLAIAAALLARTPWSAAALDALVAHAVTVLNVALTSVTDATELHALGGLLVSDASD